MLCNIKRRDRTRPFEINSRHFLLEKVDIYGDLFKAELSLLERKSGVLDDADVVKFGRAMANIIKDLTYIK